MLRPAQKQKVGLRLRLKFCIKYIIYCLILQEHLAEQGSLSLDDAEEVKRQSLEAEDQLEKAYDMKAAYEAQQLRRNLQARKEEKMKKLLEKQAVEKAEVNVLAVILLNVFQF